MADPKITLEEVSKVAGLARLELGDEDLARAQHELDAILAYMDELNALDVSNVAPTFHAIPMAAPLRQDEVDRCVDREEALAQAPAAEAGGFSVPQVLEADG